jgi:hypothetical protein
MRDGIEAKNPATGSLLGLWRFALVRWPALAVLLAIYAFASLEPFDWRVPERVPNGVTRLAEAWSFPSAGIVVADPPLVAPQVAPEAETLDVLLEVRPHRDSQSGPAHILTIADPDYDPDLIVAQDGDDLVLRLREDADPGRALYGSPIARLENMLPAERWVAIDLGIRPGKLTIAIDGTQELAAALPPSVLATWRPDLYSWRPEPYFEVALGNDLTCKWPWLGDIRKAVIAGPNGATDYALFGQVEAPPACTVLDNPPKLVPLRGLGWEDALVNAVMYLPLGCLLGLMVRRRDRRTFGMLLFVVAGVSLSFESLQLLIPSRFPSIDDMLFNKLGGALGIALGFWLMRRLAPRLPAW